MIDFYTKARCAFCESDDKLTTGSVGVQVTFHFDHAWNGLYKTAVFRGSDTAVDVLITGDACTVPPEVLTKAGGDLTIGVYGTDGTGTVVIPTVYADAGRIQRGAEPSGVDPEPPTPSLVDQILAAAQAARTAAQAARDAAEDAEEVAQSVRDDADSGAFDGEDGADGAPGLDGTDGVSPTLTVGDITGGHRITITDASGTRTVDVMDGAPGQNGADGAPGQNGAPGAPGADGYSPTVSVTDITDGHRVTITDKNGAHSFDVMDGPAGPQGPAPDLSAYRTAAAQDVIDQEQDAAISGKLDSTGNAYRAASIPMGHLDAGSTATVMTAQVPGITELRDGVCVWLANGVIASASGVTLNINDLGAKPIYNSLAGTAVTTTFAKAATYLFVYNSTRVSGGCWDMVYGYDANTTYTPAKLGFGYGVCSTAAATVAKTASISSYTLVAGGIVAIKFDNDVPANATLNITSKGAKAIYYQGAPITAGVIKTGDTATFIYSTYYHLIAIDRASVDADQGVANAGKFLVVGSDGYITTQAMTNAETEAM